MNFDTHIQFQLTLAWLCSEMPKCFSVALVPFSARDCMAVVRRASMLLTVSSFSSCCHGCAQKGSCALPCLQFQLSSRLHGCAQKSFCVPQYFSVSTHDCIAALRKAPMLLPASSTLPLKISGVGLIISHFLSPLVWGFFWCGQVVRHPPQEGPTWV